MGTHCDKPGHHLRHQPTHEDLDYVWKQYEYRHKLCWDAVVKVTAAVVALGLVPYLKDAPKTLGPWLLAPPIVGVVLAWLGYYLIRNELRLFSHIKAAYLDMHGRFVDKVVSQEWRDYAKERIQPCELTKTPFDRNVKRFVVGLVILSALNALFLFGVFQRESTQLVAKEKLVGHELYPGIWVFTTNDSTKPKP